VRDERGKGKELMEERERKGWNRRKR